MRGKMRRNASKCVERGERGFGRDREGQRGDRGETESVCKEREKEEGKEGRGIDVFEVKSQSCVQGR